MSSSEDLSRHTSDRRILLVDCDMFYVQVARLEDPEGVGRESLLIVGGSASGRGVVTSASYEARKFGVRSAMPTAQALRLCPDAVVVPVPMDACRERSRTVRETLQELSPVVEAASIDEFYLDLTGTERLLKNETLEETAWRIRETVLEKTEISVSVGGATRKSVAKLATGLAKPSGVHIVPPRSEAEFMRRFELHEIPGVGPSLLRALEKRGLRTVDDILPVEERWLIDWLGESRGRWLFRRVRGLDSTVVDPAPRRKSISSERTFAVDITDDEELDRVLLKQVLSVGRSLRRKGFVARTVTVKIRDDDFTTRQARHTVPEPIESDHAIQLVARDLLAELRRRRRRGVRLLGVGVGNLSEGMGWSQMGLFREEAPVEDDRSRTIARTMDDLRDRFGDDAILPGTIRKPKSK